MDNDVNMRLGHSTSSSEPSLETMEKTAMPTKKEKPLSLRIQRGRRHVLKFTAEEDNLLLIHIQRIKSYKKNTLNNKLFTKKNIRHIKLNYNCFLKERKERRKRKVAL